MTLSLVDTHCHLHRPEFDLDREAVLKRAEVAGVVAFIDPAIDLASSHRVVALAQHQPNLFAAVGIHPHEAKTVDSKTLEELTTLATQPKVVAIGEIGLDTFRELSPRKVQQEVLVQLLRLAHTLGKPVILHCRGSATVGSNESEKEVYRELFQILRENLKPPIRGVLHCFASDLKIGMEAIELGLYLSFAGNLTFSKSQALQAVAKEVPFDKVLLETDAPYLSPQSFRGKRNEPAYLLELVQTWSKLQDLTAQDVARVTTTNAYQLFGIGPAPTTGKIAYPIRHSLYLNITNACTDRCVFCALSTDEFWAGKGSAPLVKGHHLRIRRDPSTEELLREVGDPTRYEELVFCGYGEPVIRLDVLLEVGKQLKARGAKKIRLNTNGHGNLIHRRSIAVELKGVIDEISVSLNASSAQQYLEICRPAFGLPTYDSIKSFIRECRDAGICVTATVVGMPGVDVEACRRIAQEELGVNYRIRTYNDLG